MENNMVPVLGAITYVKVSEVWADIIKVFISLPTGWLQLASEKLILLIKTRSSFVMKITYS